MNRLSLRARLTVLYGTLSILAGAVILTLIFLVVQARLDAQLAGDADSRIAALRQKAGQSEETVITTPDGRRIGLDDLVDQIRDNEEKIRNAALDTLLMQGSGIVLTIGLATAGAGWILAGRGLRPLHAITTTAERIARSTGPHRDLSRRIALTGRSDDIQRLAAAFDAMLDNLEGAFDGQRRFVATASHELRTPLALERAVLELEATRPGVHLDAVHLAERLLAINAKNSDLVDRLLTLADGSNEVTEPIPVDLADLTADVLAQTRTETPTSLRIDASLQAARVLGDPILLHQLLRNLLENAVEHNAPAGWIKITTGSGDGSAYIAITNSGQRLLPHDIHVLFEPFRRGRSDHAHGTGRRGVGLGLAIVKAITDSHHGHITAQPGEHGGLALRIAFPEVPPAWQ